MRGIIIVAVIFLSTHSCSAQTTHHVMDMDTALFEFKLLDGREEIFLKNYSYQDGKYIVHFATNKNKVRMKFEFNKGKLCGELIKYDYKGSVISRKDYGKCK
jgi:hypothetical protein